LPVLLEVGLAGGRAGCRSGAAASSVATAVASSSRLRLTGVEMFEAVYDDKGRDAAFEHFEVVVRRLAREGAFSETHEVLLTAGGSRYFAEVIARFRAIDVSLPTRVVLRSGCYVTHDSGDYAASLKGRDLERALIAALELWGVVLSRPEPSLAIVGFGRRDAPYDLGLPTPLKRARSGMVSDLQSGVRVLALNDQHAYLEVPLAEDIEVGDLIGCGISHPCSAFDRWRFIAVVDGDYRIVDTVETFF